MYFFKGYIGNTEKRGTWSKFTKWLLANVYFPLLDRLRDLNTFAGQRGANVTDYRYARLYVTVVHFAQFETFCRRVIGIVYTL